MNRKTLGGLVAAGMMLLLGGCQQMQLAEKLDFDLSRGIPWRMDDEKAALDPDRIVAVWTEATMHQGGKKPMRGFGGRLMFYRNREDTPIKIHGELVVYAFDESKAEYDTEKPDRKYVYTPDQLKERYSKCALGHSYSVWVPWDEVGGVQSEISLIVRFTPKSGIAVVSDSSRQLLSGMPRDYYAKQQQAAQAMQQQMAATGMLPQTPRQGMPNQYLMTPEQQAMAMSNPGMYPGTQISSTDPRLAQQPGSAPIQQTQYWTDSPAMQQQPTVTMDPNRLNTTTISVPPRTVRGMSQLMPMTNPTAPATAVPQPEPRQSQPVGRPFSAPGARVIAPTQGRVPAGVPGSGVFPRPQSVGFPLEKYPALGERVVQPSDGYVR
ncbi:Hypothetical protein PBC10988_28390 [Planctomycetales bacterium 10988]|nr:Hypothetical protein PBC10988_28390 [Planctomycetales bacterium 10988]